MRKSWIGIVVLCCCIGCVSAAAEKKAGAKAAPGAVPSWARVSKEQIAEAKKLGVPVAFANALGMKFVLVPRGKFMMGSPEDEQGRYKGEGPQHEVTIGKPFYAAIHQMTQGPWEAVMGTRPWDGKAGAKNNPAHVVNWVDWNDATAFCAALSKKTGRTYRLLSEAEWEYACRAGSTTRYCYGNDPKVEKLHEYAWFGKDGWWGRKEKFLRPPGLKKPNAWGLYDIHGSVWEMCMDVMHPNYKGAPTDGSAWMTGAPKDHEPGHPLRGGGSHSSDRRVRSASRHSYRQSHKSHYVGFRVACELKSKAK
jgi:formylglycine-generating enzyme required for sulfatase activity